MTRITSFGRKRTYLEAGLQESTSQAPATSLRAGSEARDVKPDTQLDAGEADAGTTQEPQKKKKRIRTPMSKRDGYAAKRAAEEGTLEGGNVPVQPTSVVQVGGKESKQTLGTKKKKNKKKDRQERILSATEARRQKRIQEKLAHTTCFMCREKGHAAKDCPTSRNNVAAGEHDDGEGKPTTGVGICYRCGSKKHSLSRCKKPSNPADPYPFASCFVCNGKGHLASACVQNKSKGIYPNGGCCKLCGETTHLARNCEMRQKVNEPTTVIGTIGEAGADEDDFHTFKRTTTELERAEKEQEKMKKMLEVKKGVLSGVVVAPKYPPVLATKKKVVVFK